MPLFRSVRGFPTPGIRPILLILLLSASHAFAQPLVINELLSSNRRGLLDESGSSSDWIELFNPSSTALELTGYSLTDDVADPRKWLLRNGVIPPGGFLLIFADGKDRQVSTVAPIEPGRIPGLVSWIRASAIATNDTNQVRRSGVLYFIKSWADLSVSGNGFTQASTSLQPLWIAPTNNLPAAVRFDGNNDLMTLRGALATNSFCIIAVLRNRAGHEVEGQSGGGTGGTAGQRYLFGANHLGAVDAGMGVSMGTNGVSIYEHGDSYMPPLAVLSAPFSNQFQVVALQYSNKAPTIHWQGNLVVEGVTSSRRNVAAPTGLGSGPYGSWSGDLTELLIFNRSLTPDELTGVQRHLLASYQLPSRDFLHANFAISAAGETLRLTSPAGVPLDEVRMPGGMPPDVSVGRSPDGSGPWRFFEAPTPGASNSTPASTELLSEPSFSHAAGYHTNAFQLILSTPHPGAVIRYTLDGSEPTAVSPQYTTPLSITNRSRTPNNLSLIPTVPGGGSQPSTVVYKFMVVRARTFMPGGVPSDTVTRTFIVDPRGAGRFTLPVVSLTSARANLFSDATGIYVPGNAPGGNYAQTGDAWERPGWVEFFEPDGTLGFSQGTGIRMHGNTSFGFPLKGLRLHPLNFPGSGPFKHRIFPARPTDSFNRLLLRPSGHDYNLTLFRDVFMQSLGAELGLDTQDSRAALLFINGEYWGIHHCQEAFEPGYFAAHSPGVDPDQVDYLEGYAGAVEGDITRWNEMMQFLQNNNIRTSANYARLGEFMDPANYAAYKVAETYYYRWDIGNHRLWRPRTPEGRFRWILFDCDVGWGGFWAVPPAWSFRMLDYNLEANGPWTQYSSNPGGNDHNGPAITYLLRTLMDNADFKRDFINRFADVMNTTFQSNHVIRRIDAFAAQLAPEIREHVQRWQAPGSTTEWSNSVRYLRQFAIHRPTFMRQQITNRFGLPGFTTVTLRVNDTNRGSIQLNTITVAGTSEVPWTGVYFRNHPIRLSGMPRAGYRFSGWEELDLSTQPINLTLTNPVTFTARFETDPGHDPHLPSGHVLGSGPFRLTGWDPLLPPGTYPANTRLHQSTQPDPSLATGVTMEDPWPKGYSLTNRSRVLGLGEGGLGFLNTSDPQGEGGGYLGALVVGLNTLDAARLQTRFTAGTVQPNSRTYGIRLQSRVGDSEPFTDVVDGQGRPVEYVRSVVAGHQQTIGPITLPNRLAGQPYVQLRWVYHHLTGNNGSRAFLRLDDILVAEEIYSGPVEFEPVALSPQGSLTLRGRAAPLMSFRLEGSENLAGWEALGEVRSSVAGGFEIALPMPPGRHHYFLRLSSN